MRWGRGGEGVASSVGCRRAAPEEVKERRICWGMEFWVRGCSGLVVACGGGIVGPFLCFAEISVSQVMVSAGAGKVGSVVGSG